MPVNESGCKDAGQLQGGSDAPIKAAIFDVDGTLLDSMGVWADIASRYLRSIHVTPGENLDQILAPMSMEEGAAYVKEHYHLRKSIPEIIQGVMDAVKCFYQDEVQMKPGALEFLGELHKRGIPMAAATASEREHIEAAFDRLGARKYFRRLFTCREVGAGKRSPLIYQAAGEFLGEKPSDIYVFEDVLHAVMTAKNAGFRTVGVYDRYNEGEQEEIKKQADFYLPAYGAACLRMSARPEM